MGLAVYTINFSLVMESGTRKGRKVCNIAFAIPWPFLL
jgi:hypothetical protein